MSLSRLISLWFHSEIRAATYREQNEAEGHPSTPVPTHQTLTPAAFASAVGSVLWHCLHQRAGCLKYHWAAQWVLIISELQSQLAAVATALSICLQSTMCAAAFQDIADFFFFKSLTYYKILFLLGLRSGHCKEGLERAGIKWVITLL